MGEESAVIIALMLESDGPGGAEQMLLGLARELRASGHRIVPVVPADGAGWLGDRLRAEGFRPSTFHLSSPFDPACVGRLRRLFREEGVEVVHAHEFTMAVYAGAAARLSGLPYVITMHGSRYYAEHTRRRVAFGWVARSAGALVAVSRATARDLESVLKLEAGSVQVVPNGHRLSPGAGGGVRRELGLDHRDPLLVSVGNLYPVKGHDVLLEALGRLQENGGLWAHLAIVGRGGEREALEERSRQLGIHDRVHLLGFRSDVADILAAADIFALPSRSEGLPLALLEAMFAGKPIVATRVGGIPEVVHDGVHALLVETGSVEGLRDALSRLLGDPPLGKRLARAARERAERRYSPDAMASAYEQLYQSAVLAKASHHGPPAKERRA